MTASLWYPDIDIKQPSIKCIKRQVSIYDPRHDHYKHVCYNSLVHVPLPLN